MRDLRRQRRKAERAWRSGKGPKADYADLRHKYEALEFIKRCNYNQKSLRMSAGDAKALHKKLRRLMGKAPQDLPNSANMKKIAEDFKTYFLEKVEGIRESISEERNDPHIDENHHVSANGDTSPIFNTFSIPSVDDIKGYVTSMTNKFCTLDPIPTFLLKEFVDELSPLLHHIVKMSLSSPASVVSGLKKAVVNPILKKESLDADLLKNYRPVSNLSVVSKLLEKIVFDQLSSYLDDEDLHCKMQSGYRAHHSCETLLIKMMDDILGDMNEGRIVIVVLLDLSAAFDTIDHDILLDRLRRDFGICGNVLQWFKSYLEDRSFSVKVGAALSSFLEIVFGVPQGSLLGPILFIMYIKYLEEIADKYGLKIKLYADDSQLYTSFIRTHQMNFMISLREQTNALRKSELG